jgi:four helix bundle protein
MSQKSYDLEERTYEFSRDVRFLVKKLPQNIMNIEDCKQVIRSSGSIAANYIEANEALSKKDFSYRIKISRKEAKESVLWLRLLKNTNEEFSQELSKLIEESNELKKILSAIYEKSK